MEAKTARKVASPKARLLTTGHALSLFLLVSYLLCVCFGLLVPESARMHEAWGPLLPGFEWLTVEGFIAGSVGAYLYGWYIAGLFIPLKIWAEKRHEA